MTIFNTNFARCSSANPRRGLVYRKPQSYQAWAHGSAMPGCGTVAASGDYRTSRRMESQSAERAGAPARVDGGRGCAALPRHQAPSQARSHLAKKCLRLAFAVYTAIFAGVAASPIADGTVVSGSDHTALTFLVSGNPFDLYERY